MIIHNRQDLEHRIITMYHQEGWAIRALARHFSISRNTVREILRDNEGRRDNAEHNVRSSKTPRRSKLDTYLPEIRKILQDYPDITGERLYEKLRDAGYQGGITIVRKRLRKLRPRPKKKPIIRFETEPGEQGQMDWSPYTISFTSGGKTTVLCFSYILGYSRRQFIDFTLDRKFPTLIRRHQDAFAYFGGVPRHCLYDGEKTVLLRWEAGQPVYNPAFIDFITHYRCRPVACRAGRPQTKGKVEAPFQYVEKNFFGGRRFKDLADLRDRARWWLREKSDRHVHGTTRRAPLELFLGHEQAALIPLPRHPYDSSEVALRVCRMDGFLEFETNLYSVPFEYVADILTLKATEQEVVVYSPDLTVVARHERLALGLNTKTEKPEHRPTKRIRYGLEPVKEAFLRLGDAAEPFLAGLTRASPRNAGFHARFILHLKERWHSDDINRAMKHAQTYHAFDCRAIERILQARAVQRTLESKRNERARQAIAARLPHVKQRSLEAYDNLLSTSHRQEKDHARTKDQR